MQGTHSDKQAKGANDDNRTTLRRLDSDTYETRDGWFRAHRRDDGWFVENDNPVGTFRTLRDVRSYLLERRRYE